MRSRKSDTAVLDGEGTDTSTHPSPEDSDTRSERLSGFLTTETNVHGSLKAGFTQLFIQNFSGQPKTAVFMSDDGVIVADNLKPTLSCDLYLDVEQPCLQVAHSLLSQSQVPDHHIQGFVREEALVDRGHAGRTTDVPHAECHRILL